jgi:ion channel-forming bestrophin family protein
MGCLTNSGLISTTQKISKTLTRHSNSNFSPVFFFVMLLAWYILDIPSYVVARSLTFAIFLEGRMMMKLYSVGVAVASLLLLSVMDDAGASASSSSQRSSPLPPPSASASQSHSYQHQQKQHHPINSTTTTTSSSREEEESIKTTVVLHDEEPPSSSSNSNSLMDAFRSDVDRLTLLQSQQSQLLPIFQPSHSKRDSSYTKTWTSEDWIIAQRPCWKRYRDHLSSWYKSPTAMAVFPAVSIAVGWAALVVLVSHHVPFLAKWIHSCTFAKVEISTAPIALLLTLRTNKGLDRLFEARAQWGILVRAVTQLSAMAATYLQPQDPQASLLFARYLVVLGWSVKGLFRGEDDQPVVAQLLPPTEANFVLTTTTTADHPSAILFRLRSLLASHAHHLPVAAHHAMETSLSDMEKAFGICRRILGSPIPPTYTRHTSRVLCSYLALLPLSLVDKGVSSVAILLSAAIISYVFIGIDEIGVEVEHPFPLLPLHSLCNKMQTSVVQQFCMSSLQPQII